MKNLFYEKRCRYSIRKLSIGACSLMIGSALFASPALAEQVAAPETAANTSAQATSASETAKPDTTALEKQLSETENKVAEQPISENPPAIADLVNEKEEAKPASTDKTEKPAQPTEKEEVKPAEAPQVAEKKADKPTLADVPKNEEKSLRPKEIKFDTWEDLLKWEPGAREDDPINRSSVELAKRHRGQLVNEKASRRAKVQALANTNSKAKDHASVGGEEFKAYAFDYWQYLDSMVFWEGLVPTPDVIDAGHRNGVPVYGTLFFNWSNSIADQEKFAAALKQDADGTFPIARKLVDLAKYYGFDGYFINQETTGELVEPLGEKMRQFMLYTKEYAAKVNHPIKYAWYDAMTYKYGRYHEDGLGDYNYQFMQKEGDKVPADQFFANFNWNKEKNDHSVEMAKWLERSQYDVFAGLELQQGGSYKTKVKWDALLDEKGKLRLSLGLFAPDTITSLGKTGEDYHKNEDIFFTGYQGDPTAQKPADKEWYGIANLVADRTPAVGRTFTTSFNTGHGRKWFVDGKVSKDSEWNYRSVSGVLPTWRWWQTSTGEKLRAEYDFTDAYNGGNSLKFSGDVAGKTDQDVNLYSTKLEVTEKTKLRVAHKGGKGSKVYMAFSTTPDYKFEDAAAWKELTLSDDWKNEEFDLSSLAGKTIYAVKLFFEHEGAVKDYQFNLGQLTISDNHQAPQAPTGLSVVKQSLKNAQEAEAVVQFAGNQDADFYEVYEKDGDNWRLLTGSSASTIYLPKVSRSANATGTTQELKVVAVGKNGLRSEAATASFNWGMTVQDTTLPRPLAENIVPGATVIGSTFPNTEGGEGIEGMLNGTITSLSDKWSSAQLSGSVDIRLTKPRTVVRWVMDHAGAGGESVNDGLMNTKDFDLYYKDTDGEWKLAKEVRGNKAHVTDITLDKPITAQDWRLKVITSDNGTPWKAIRIYNWKMYETLDTESQNIPMAKVAARSLGNHQVQLGFSDVPAGATITVYDKADSQTPIATLKSENGGDLATAPLAFDKQPNLLYYRTQLPGKEISNTLAVAIPQDERKIAAVSLEKGPKKTVYKEGEKLDLRGGTLRVQYEGGQADELINLTHSGVTVSGYDAHQKGEQKLTVSYLGLPVTGDLKVQVTGQDEGKPKEVAGLYITQKPKTDYLVGEQLDLAEGRFGVLYDDETEESHAFTDQGVEITGYDAQKTGRQTLTLHYKGHTAEFDVLVSPKAAVNDEYLKQEITAAQGRQSTLAYTFSSEDKQAALVEKLNAAKAVAENHNASQEEVNRALNELKQAGTDLDGNQRYQTAREELEGLLESVREKDPKAELIAQAETLLASEMPTPQTFAEMKEKLNKKLAPAEESHHVGSMDPNEVAPTVEALPELVIETETTAFEHQERPNAELLKGQRQLVQAGAEGQVRRFVEVDTQGKRTLRSTEVVKEAIPEITEVGTKVLSSNQPAEGIKDLVLEIPKLEIEEGTVSFERQERLNAELLKGQRRVVQAGVEGQVRRFVEVDGQGKRTLRSTEVLKEAIPEITEVGTKVLSSSQPAEGVKDLVLETPKLEIEEGTISFERQERPNSELLKGQRQLVQAGVEGQVRRFVEVDAQGKRTLHSTEVVKEAIPEIVEVGTKEEQVSQTRDQALSAAPAKVEEVSKELPNTGATRDASLVALGLLGVMSGYGLLAGKKRED
ncbi:bacterial Ig-like domain-containing protein [Streptococcus oralis]|uniref:Endo-beta-N-acetylglucosaminidase n=1 Tax=Streptococcus oralis subsp. tigurinus TaxID=1077464 RepID=A0AAX0N5M7_STROR|nr:bacterial Ig-like domain-containing protein [Streptococcus oralis]MCY7082446.1 bacterial Ig-like domain-containing protein [Streptococcus oralis]MCY7107077.1 bacterial Ig-like domain-containing protein [Streptococcus oralis]ORO33688.1 endo-beta-N-acetylglucosaminidase [Streptococcus oralis subsp. tigurinus]